MSAPVLVCFAVSQEAKPFRKLVRDRGDVVVLLTGMGARNATDALERVFGSWRPSRVFACGFAGALNPELKIGDVVFQNAGELESPLLALGASKARIHSAERVAITRHEKAELRRVTGADAVDMESAAIRNVCAAGSVSCVCLRAISDAANEDLPLDFNALMTRDQRFSYPRLFLAMTRSPHAVPALARLGRQSALAARELASALAKII